MKGHLWDANRRNWGYGGLPQNKEEYKERYHTSLEMLHELQAQGIAGGVYTQTTDVEGEINGLMTYDRKVIKIPAKEARELCIRCYSDRTTKQPADSARSRDGYANRARSWSLRSFEPVWRVTIARLYIKAGWIRDPYIVLAPDGYLLPDRDDTESR